MNEGRKEKRKEERKNERKKLKCFCSLLPPPTLLTHHPASRYARGHSGLASLGILIKLFSSDKVNRQGNFYTILLSFGHQVFDYLGSLFIKQRSANLYTGAKIKISLYTKNMINSQSRQEQQCSVKEQFQDKRQLSKKKNKWEFRGLMSEAGFLFKFM